MKWIQAPALAGCLALLVGVSVAAAQTETGGSQSSTVTNKPAKSGGSDKMFVQKAMEGGMAEVQLGQLAAQKGSSEEVKQFGQKMVDDHTKLNQQMTPIASQMGISPPAQLSSQDQALQSKLSGLSGESFDKAYMQAMVNDHRKDLAEFKKEASNGKNSQVKDAAQQGAQIIQQHLQMAEHITGSHNWGPAGKGSAAAQ